MAIWPSCQQQAEVAWKFRQKSQDSKQSRVKEIDTAQLLQTAITVCDKQCLANTRIITWRRHGTTHLQLSLSNTHLVIDNRPIAVYM